MTIVDSNVEQRAVLSSNMRKKLALEAMRKSTRVRTSLSLDVVAPVCPFDAANQLNIKVKFEPLKSVEGLYVKGKPALITITSLRPTGRQAFSCAHEIGHHIFGHGTRSDQIIAYGSDIPEEYLADCFAGFFLMPPSVVNNAFTIRKWDVSIPHYKQVYVVAGVLGVGYETLITHMTYSLQLISVSKARALQKHKPIDIREELLGERVSDEALFVDKFWPSQHRTVDVRTGDYVVVPHETTSDGNTFVHARDIEVGRIYRADRPGNGRFINFKHGLSVFTRVSRNGFTGRSIYRHLEDEEYEG